MNPEREHAFVLARSHRYKLAFGYAWRREDFPWLSRWAENHLRPWAAWNSNSFALGMEFGVAPLVESRRKIVERGTAFDTATFRCIPARTRECARCCACVRPP